MTSINPQRYADLTDATSEASSYAEQAQNLLADVLGQHSDEAVLSPNARVMVGVGFALLSIGKRLQAVEEVLGQDLDLRTHPAKPVSVPTVRPTPIRGVRS
jgi:hypothetical protein